ncbi:MAG: hypothetical protein KAY37_08470 [Phycisphaerae bacterium]|nr:hypothetical protein [Phycisphaerae bacterium]
MSKKATLVFALVVFGAALLAGCAVVDKPPTSASFSYSAKGGIAEQESYKTENPNRYDRGYVLDKQTSAEYSGRKTVRVGE